MRTRAVAAGLAFTSLMILASIAVAGPCEERPLGPLGQLGHLPPVPLVESADVIVVFRPHIDIVTISSVERVVPGDIERVEKGVAPRTIVYTANTFGAWVRAGERAKVFLAAFRDRDAHYIIGTLPPEMPSPSVSVTVSATSYGGSPVRATRIGSSVLIEARVAVDERVAPFAKADVYAGLLRPDGTTVWISGNALAPTLVESATPVPFLVASSAKTSAIGVTYQFSDADPPGAYLLYAVVVRPGDDPREPCDWIHTSTFPLLVTAPAAPPHP